MKLTKSVGLNAKNLITGQPTNQNPHKKGQTFDRSETEIIDRLRMRMVPIHKSKTVKSFRDEKNFRVNPT